MLPGGCNQTVVSQVKPEYMASNSRKIEEKLLVAFSYVPTSICASLVVLLMGSEQAVEKVKTETFTDN